MSTDSKFTRRDFVQLCAGITALLRIDPSLAQSSPVRRYERAQLVDVAGEPITASTLKVGENYLFHYPYTATPCFLLNLGQAAAGASLVTEDGKRYQWSGGVGPRRAVVAFSAICAHRMSHPAREVSFINYRHQRVTFTDTSNRTIERSQVIHCCSERSVYDPTQGALVLGGPAKQPLAAVLLEQDTRGALYAVGTAGGELFDRFFEKFGARIALELRTHNIRQSVKDSAVVRPLTQYCQQQILC